VCVLISLQVTDTPGLLARPDDQRNKMELLTLAALACLPTSVLFVTDLTEECGTSVADQWAIRYAVCNALALSNANSRGVAACTLLRAVTDVHDLMPARHCV
jgi:GTP1/Obg family GTP-binding protein